MTASSLLVPAAGVLTQPILAQALGVDGRGRLAAAVAPAALVLAVATLGLPDALTYYLAKHPRITRHAVAWAAFLSFATGLVCLGATVLAAPALSAGDPQLASLIVLGMALTVPALLVGVFRGAAVGRQMWTAVATERLVNTTMRIVALGTLFVTGELTVVPAVLITTLTPVACGIVYWRLFTRPPSDAPDTAPDPDPDPDPDADLGGRVLRPLLSFGSRVWLGAVAEMLLGRLGQVLMTPLSSISQLGLYSVAITISDLPLVVAIAIQGTLFGVNSRTRDAAKITGVTRLTVLVALLGCGAIAASLPFWIGPLFGDEFRAATVPTIMLLISALVCIPGLMAAIALSAWGRPGLRSVGLAITLATNAVAFVLLVPPFGVYGACATSILSNVVMTGYMTVACRRVLGVGIGEFLLVGPRDAVRAWQEAQRLLRRGRRQAVRP